MTSPATRHWIFLGLLVVVVVSMSLNLRTKVTPTEETLKLYRIIDSLPAGSIVMISFDHEASALPEIRPLTLAILRHAFTRGHRLIGVALLAEGTGIGYGAISRTAAEYGKTYGADYAYLGFQPQSIAAILSMGESIEATFPRDYLGAPYDSVPLLAMTNNYNQIAMVISIADGSLTTQWIEYGKARFDVPVVAVVTAAMMTTYDPYLASGQLSAMIGGLRGAAEYEELIHRPGSGARGMLAQTSAHIYVIVMILLGNIMYFRLRRARGGR
jgi:hypothetical protein